MSEFIIELNSSEMDVWRKQVEEQLAAREGEDSAFLEAMDGFEFAKLDELSPHLRGTRPGEMTILLSEDPPRPKERVMDYEVGEELVKDGVSYYVSQIWFLSDREYCYDLRRTDTEVLWGGGSTPQTTVNSLFCRTGREVYLGFPPLLKESVEEQTPKEDCGYVRAEDVNGNDAMNILRNLI